MFFAYNWHHVALEYTPMIHTLHRKQVIIVFIAVILAAVSYLLPPPHPTESSVANPDSSGTRESAPLLPPTNYVFKH